MKGIVFIRIMDESIQPVLFVKHLFQKIKETGVASSRFIARIIPIECTCYAHVDEVLSLVKELIPSVFTKDREGSTVIVLLPVHA